jgi:hypothetical protein
MGFQTTIYSMDTNTDNDNIIKLLIVEPVTWNRVHYMINEGEQKHAASDDEIKKVIGEIDKIYLSDIPYYLKRRLPFYIDVQNKTVNPLRYNNEEEFEKYKKNLMAVSRNEMIAEHRRQSRAQKNNPLSQNNSSRFNQLINKYGKLS